ncbi:hypothetical protein [Methyloversatilis sp. XJ19-49]|uniref:hypothetical protein n=1 Tax=Methyloversatilis sp. XJ19-49 TaxID=2963429 RepID=UPI00211B9A55|nr:hypothetical protein [Methyloversatilis sp. XJ19-49]MCQ9377756.1 hypothetical protein [Methyloversatilis sp. XJ19-49]
MPTVFLGRRGIVVIRQVSATHTIAAIAISAVLIVASQNVQAILPVDNRSPDPLRVTNSDFKNLFDTSALVDIVIVPSDYPQGAAGCSGYSVGQGLVLTAAHCLSKVVEEDPTKPAGQSATAGKIFGIRSPGSVWVSSGADNPRTVKAYDDSWLVTPNARTEAFGRGYAVEFHPVWDLALLRTTSETPSRFYGASVFLIPDLIMGPSDRAAVVEVNNLFFPLEPPAGFPSQEVFNFIPAFKAGYSYPGGDLTRTALISAAFIAPTPRIINDGDFSLAYCLSLRISRDA